MRSILNIMRGARVRTRDGYIGRVERLETRVANNDGQPDTLLVQSDDGRWHFAIPLLLVQRVRRAAGNQLVQVEIPREELAHYLVKIPPETPTAAPTAAWSGDETIPLAAEDLAVRKEPIVRGHVHIHKGVETSEQRMVLPVYREEAIIERIPAEQYNGQPSDSPDEIIIPLVEERLVVQREVVVREYLRVRRQRVVTPYEVRGTLRREVAEVTRDELPDPNITPATDGLATDSARTDASADAPMASPR